MVMPKSWIRHMPQGLREQPGWVFIGLLVAIVGLSFVVGIGDSAISLAIGYAGLRWWGGFLVVSGLLTIVATVRGIPALEKLALRLMAFGLLAYAGWLLTVVPWQRGIMTVVLCLVLIVFAEIRVAFIKWMFNSAQAQKQTADQAYEPDMD